VPDISERLRLIESVKNFCTDKLGLASNNSFTKVVDQNSYYFIGISPKDRIKLEYPLSGMAAYNSLAEVNFITNMYKKVLTNTYPFKNVDIYVQEVLASIKQTCGNDTASGVDICESAQITETVLNISDAALVALIIHENLHYHASANDIYMKLPIEESLADVIAYQGSKQYYLGNNELLAQVEQHNNYWQKFYDWCDIYTKILNKAYRKSMPEGRRQLIVASQDYKKNNLPGEPDMNNAFFMMWLPYTECNASVRRILRDENPKEHVRKLSTCRQILTLKELNLVINS